MYLEHLVPKSLSIFSAPGCFIARLRHPGLVSFGLMANLAFLRRKGVFDRVDGVVDVGANIGQFAFMAHSVLPHVPVYSFEPDPVCYEKLQHTFAEHGIKGGCFPVALSDTQGSIDLNIYESSANNSMLLREHERALEVKRVECSTLDTLDKELGGMQAPYLKIDVQGAELSVLRGAAKFLGRCEFVQLEVSLVNAYSGNSHIADILAVMRAAGFRCWEILDVLRTKKTGDLGILEMDLLFVRDGERR